MENHYNFKHPRVRPTEGDKSKMTEIDKKHACVSVGDWRWASSFLERTSLRNSPLEASLHVPFLRFRFKIPTSFRFGSLARETVRLTFDNVSRRQKPDLCLKPRKPRKLNSNTYKDTAMGFSDLEDSSESEGLNLRDRVMRKQSKASVSLRKNRDTHDKKNKQKKTKPRAKDTKQSQN